MRQRWLPWSVAVLVVVVLLGGGWVVEDRGGRGPTGAPPSTAPTASGSAAPSSSPAPQPVQLPACADPAASRKLLLDTTADGPARDAVAGTVVSTAFSLEDGAFRAAPPPAGYVPAVTAEQAGCQLSSTMGVRGFSAGPGRLALASVTIAPDVKFQSSVEEGVMFTSAYPGPMPSYEHRVAWILITPATNDVSSCPAMSASSRPTPVASKAPAHPYEIFGIDAATGASAFMFEDSISFCDFAPNPPLVSVPYQVLSVPWTLVSRGGDGQSAEISAGWASCEVYTGTGTTYTPNVKPGSPPPAPKPITAADPLHVWVQRPSGDVAVTVTRPFGPECGPPTSHPLTLHPVTVKDGIPSTVPHAPVGLVAQQ